LQLTLDDFQKVSDQVPFLADLKPSGKYVMEDLHKVIFSAKFGFTHQSSSKFKDLNQQINEI
jgi:hypothetical protein